MVYKLPYWEYFRSAVILDRTISCDSLVLQLDFSGDFAILTVDES